MRARVLERGACLFFAYRETCQIGNSRTPEENVWQHRHCFGSAGVQLASCGNTQTFFGKFHHSPHSWGRTFGNVASNSFSILPNNRPGAAPRTSKLPTGPGGADPRNPGPEGVRNNVPWFSPPSKLHPTRFGTLPKIGQRLDCLPALAKNRAAARLFTSACQKSGRGSIIYPRLPKISVAAPPARRTSHARVVGDAQAFLF